MRAKMRARALALAFLSLRSLAAPEDTVTTSLGAVRGLLNPLAREFRALPYAAPPVGARRWAAPAPPAAWAPAVRDATADAPGCLQRCAEPPQACPAVVQEDCL